MLIKGELNINYLKKYKLLTNSNCMNDLYLYDKF